MPAYAILTNRKRAVIALIHSVIFLIIALRSLAVPSSSPGLFAALQSHSGTPGTFALTGIFLIVTTILGLLLSISRNTRERMYFAFCSASAATGLMRSLVGDPPFHSANLIRSMMLICAVVVGTMIWRQYSEVELSSE